MENKVFLQIIVIFVVIILLSLFGILAFAEEDSVLYNFAYYTLLVIVVLGVLAGVSSGNLMALN